MSHTSNQQGLISLAQKSVAILCLLALFDAPLVGLQTYAWIKMVWDRSESMGVSQAVIDVAGGQDPCELCLFVSREREPDDQTGLRSGQRTKMQPMALPDRIAIRPHVLLGEHSFPEPSGIGVRLHESPPVPPPEKIARI